MGLGLGLPPWLTDWALQGRTSAHDSIQDSIRAAEANPFDKGALLAIAKGDRRKWEAHSRTGAHVVHNAFTGRAAAAAAPPVMRVMRLHVRLLTDPRRACLPAIRRPLTASPRLMAPRVLQTQGAPRRRRRSCAACAACPSATFAWEGGIEAASCRAASPRPASRRGASCGIEAGRGQQAGWHRAAAAGSELAGGRSVAPAACGTDCGCPPAHPLPACLPAADDERDGGAGERGGGGRGLPAGRVQHVPRRGGARRGGQVRARARGRARQQARQRCAVRLPAAAAQLEPAACARPCPLAPPPGAAAWPRPLPRTGSSRWARAWR